MDGDAGWGANPIDTFVLRRMREAGLSPSPPANRERLFRRAALDLTGLPPELEAIDRFLNDTSEDAYEKAVARLLASEAYGERMAMAWLDVARYADTYGYQDDRESNVWPWRDWVIRAFNDNLPYDDFIRWQLAGDLLPAPTQDQRLATGFNRLHRQTNEGGSVAEEYLVEYAADRTHTFATAFLGMTMECARCHDHKFEDISQREYYELFAFFNNIDESGMYSHFTDATPTPNIFLYEAGQEKRHQKLRKAIEEAETKCDAARDEAAARFAADPSALPGSIRAPMPLVYLPFDIEGASGTPNLAGDLTPASFSGAPAFQPGRIGNAIEFSGEDAVTLKEAGIFERTDSFTLSFWLRPATTEGMQVVCHCSKATLDAGSRGYEVFLEDGHVVFGLGHFWPGNALRLKTLEALAAGQWRHLAVTYDGSSRAQGIALYLDGKPAPVETIRDHLYGTIRYEKNQPALTLGARFRDPGFKGGRIDDFQIFGNRLTALEVMAVFKGGEWPVAWSAETALAAYYAERVDRAYASACASLKKAREEEHAFAERLREAMVMQEKETPPTAYVLARGAYDARGDLVTPNTPRSILPFPEDYPRNRLGLAEWLLRRDHPLTARVAANRIWAIFFGAGLVKTQEDFGSQGAPPEAPALLDYLAAQFIASGWDVKALCKLIATSSTYRQDSTPHPERVARDPENRLLARGPRHRLGAEQIRDGALAASGLMVRKVGGPSVRPYQPEGLWREVSKVSYKQDSGAGLYRRSMYTFWKRTAPPPTMLSFDAGSREVCVARRESTMTPLQALVLLNDPQFVEAARVLAADSVAAYQNSVSARLVHVFRRLTGRRPEDAELEVLVSAYREQKMFFSAAEDDAKAYLNAGAWEAPAGDAIETAATTAVVQLIMNLDEFQVKS